MKKRKKLIRSSFLVTQSNRLVESRYNLPLSEQRLILSMISRIQPEDEDFKPYVISIHEFAEFLGISHNSMYSECKKITGALLTRVVNIEESDGLLQTNWVSSAKYIDGEGIVKLCFDPLLKPYLLQIKSSFTSCKLEMLLSFKSQYTMRFYMLLKQYENLQTRDIAVEELRNIIGLDTKRYKLYGDFKRSIILPVQKELKEKSDLFFEFEEIKQARRIAVMRFTIFRNTALFAEETDASDVLPSLDDVMAVTEKASEVKQLLTLVPEAHRQKKMLYTTIDSALQKYDFDYVERNILYSNKKSEKSYVGFLGQALKEDWGYDWHIERTVELKKKQASLRPIWEKMGFKSETDYANHMLNENIQHLQQSKKQKVNT